MHCREFVKERLKNCNHRLGSLNQETYHGIEGKATIHPLIQIPTTLTHKASGQRQGDERETGSNHERRARQQVANLCEQTAGDVKDGDKILTSDNDIVSQVSHRSFHDSGKRDLRA